MKIANKVFRLKKEAQITRNVILPKGQELEVVRDVVYMGGYPLSPAHQPIFLDWILNNQELLTNETKLY